MFESLGDKFESIFKKLRGQDKLTEANMKDALREVRLALLEADVNYKVVKDFIDATREKALGQDVIKGVNPAEQLIKVVHDELVNMMKGEGAEEDREFIVQPGKLNVIMMLGLQGAGKTTFCGKLAVHLRKKKCSPLLVACDVYRPAAVDQLRHVGKTMSFPVFAIDGEMDVLKIVKQAVEQAKAAGNDVLIIDTAGRLHIDEVKMDELVGLRDNFKPDFTFLVADAMTGQDAVNSARAFNENIGIDGVCLTKMDGDARGGAALSIKAVTGRPIVFIGTGEKPEDLEPFHPEGVAGRILGKGDIVSLVRKAQEALDEKDVMDMQSKLTSGKFSYDDFLRQMRAVRRMGPLKGLLGLIPGMGQALKNIDSDLLERELKRFEVVIQSMTEEERKNGDLLSKSGGRRERVAKGSGQPLKTVNDMVRQFDSMKAMMAQMGGGLMGGGGGLGGLMGGMNPFGGGDANPFAGGMPPMDMMGGGGMPGAPMTKKMLKAQKAMLKQQQRELAATAPRAKKDRRKAKKNKRR